MNPYKNSKNTYRALIVRFTTGTSLNKILYLHLGHFDSEYFLISTVCPHLMHLYMIILLQQYV